MCAPHHPVGAPYSFLCGSCSLCVLRTAPCMLYTTCVSSLQLVVVPIACVCSLQPPLCSLQPHRHFLQPMCAHTALCVVCTAGVCYLQTCVCSLQPPCVSSAQPVSVLCAATHMLPTAWLCAPCNTTCAAYNPCVVHIAGVCSLQPVCAPYRLCSLQPPCTPRAPCVMPTAPCVVRTAGVCSLQPVCAAYSPLCSYTSPVCSSYSPCVLHTTRMCSAQPMCAPYGLCVHPTACLSQYSSFVLPTAPVCSLQPHLCTLMSLPVLPIGCVCLLQAV